jgi:hypothetical protein
LGGDLQHPFGASTVPPGTTGPSSYNSFGDAIKGVRNFLTSSLLRHKKCNFFYFF